MTITDYALFGMALFSVVMFALGWRMVRVKPKPAQPEPIDYDDHENLKLVAYANNGIVERLTVCVFGAPRHYYRPRTKTHWRDCKHGRACGNANDHDPSSVTLDDLVALHLSDVADENERQASRRSAVREAYYDKHGRLPKTDAEQAEAERLFMGAVA